MKKRKKEKHELKKEERKIDLEKTRAFELEEEHEIERMIAFLKKTNRRCANCKIIYECVRGDREKWKKYRKE